LAAIIPHVCIQQITLAILPDLAALSVPRIIDYPSEIPKKLEGDEKFPIKWFLEFDIKYC
jgi:hypothetical protein